VKHPKCKICTDPRRHDLESALADGARLRPLARKYSISYDSLQRHWARHLTPAQKDRLKFGDAPAHKLKGMLAEAEISVLKDLNFARRSLLEALVAAPAEDAHARGTLTGRLHENTRIRGQLSGDLAKSPLISNTTINNTLSIQGNAEVEQLKADIARVLDKHPAALMDVIAYFERLENPPLALEHNVKPQEAETVEVSA
jgi:hypothetical protein